MNYTYSGSQVSPHPRFRSIVRHTCEPLFVSARVLARFVAALCHKPRKGCNGESCGYDEYKPCGMPLGSFEYFNEGDTQAEQSHINSTVI